MSADHIQRANDPEFDAMWSREYAPCHTEPTVENLCYQAMYAGWLRGQAHQIELEQRRMKARMDAMTDKQA